MKMLRVAATLATTATATVAALLLTTGAAHALPSGSGWSASWDYYTTNAFQYHATLPGVQLDGYGNDNSGTRNTVGTIQDTSADGRCARVLLYANDVGYIADRTTCGNGTYQTYSTGNFTGSLLVIVYRQLSGSTTTDKSLYTFVPPSISDAGLRTVGTGTSWSYYTSTSFQYSVRRPGVRVTGYGSHQASDLRSALSVVENTGAPGYITSCANGRAKDWNSEITAGTCAGGGSNTFSAFDFDGWIEVEACTQSILISSPKRCVVTHIPEPY